MIPISSNCFKSFDTGHFVCFGGSLKKFQNYIDQKVRVKLKKKYVRATNLMSRIVNIHFMQKKETIMNYIHTCLTSLIVPKELANDWQLNYKQFEFNLYFSCCL